MRIRKLFQQFRRRRGVVSTNGHLNNTRYIYLRGIFWNSYNFRLDIVSARLCASNVYYCKIICHRKLNVEKKKKKKRKKQRKKRETDINKSKPLIELIIEIFYYFDLTTVLVREWTLIIL
ncbi:hypothetical protein PUN28_004128 [Cardiocondyla obscurior]|uniref:Ribosomal protein L20 n=1 Tax=Cardiocondyla obscurior TaxID=286306 RepID=A0AAW2GPP1_9HYME